MSPKLMSLQVPTLVHLRGTPFRAARSASPGAGVRDGSRGGQPPLDRFASDSPPKPFPRLALVPPQGAVRATGGPNVPRGPTDPSGEEDVIVEKKEKTSVPKRWRVIFH